MNDEEEEEEEEELVEEGTDELIEILDGHDGLPFEEDEELQAADSPTEMGIEEEDTADFTFQEHSDSVCCVAFHPFEENLVLTGGCDDQAFLWCFPMSKNSSSWFKLLEGHEDTVTAVDFNFNGKLALTGSYDGKVRVWDIDLRPEIRLLHVFDGPEDIEWAVFHNKGNGILAGSKDGTVWLWFVQPPKCINVFAGHDGLVSIGAFVGDGKLICTGGEDGTVRLWNPKSGQCRAVLEGSIADSGDVVTCLATDGDIIAAGYNNGTVNIYLTSGAKLLLSLRHSQFEEESNTSSVECIALYQNHLRLVATGGMNNLLSIWDLTTGSKRTDCPHNDGVVACSWNKSLPLICSASLDTFVRLWDGRNGLCLQTFSGHRNAVLTIKLRVNNSTGMGLLVSGSDDSTAKVFHVDFKRFFDLESP